MSRLQTGDLRIDHYRNYLVETYYHAGQNPQIQALATFRFPQTIRKTTKMFYQHAIAEIGHDVLALNDLQALGLDTEAVVSGSPLPATQGLIAYGYYSCMVKSHLDYLGYLFHLEFMPTQNGADYMEFLKSVGVPDNALTFIQEHAEVDVQHNKMMKKYVEVLVNTDSDLEKVIASAKVTCVLHHRMIFDAFAAAEAEGLQQGTRVA